MANKQKQNNDQRLKIINKRFKDGGFLPTPEDIERVKVYCDKMWGYHPQLHEETPQAAQAEAISMLHGLAEAGFIHSDISFCMMDIVGFGELVSSTKDVFGLYKDIITPVLSSFTIDLENAGKFLSLAFRSRTPKKSDLSDIPKLETLLFADTIVIYPAFGSKVHRIFHEPFVQVWLVAMAARDIIMSCLNKELLIRGSIGFGECLITKKPISYLGQTIMEVHSIESVQNWGGVALAPSAAETMRIWKELPREICRYKVPWKSGSRVDDILSRYPYKPGSENYVVDWSFYGHAACNENVGPWLRSQANKAEEEHKIEVRDIYRNTLTFLELRLSEDEARKP